MKTIIIHTFDYGSIDNLEKLVLDGLKISKIIYVNGSEWEYSANVAGRPQGVKVLLKIVEQQSAILEIVNGSTRESKWLIDSSVFNKHKLHYWETYWLSCTYCVHAPLLHQTTVNEDYKFCIISLNRRPHVHRCLMIDLMAKYNLIDNNAISWQESKNPNERYGPKLISEARGYQYKYWKPKILILDKQSDNIENYWLLPEEYNHSFCQLVVESTLEVPFISEKTCMPLFYMKPFMVASIEGYHQMLKRMGFELYTELFDYSFDSIQDTETRFEEIAKNLEKINLLSKSELVSLYNSVKDKLLYNKNHAVMLASKLEHQPEILTEIYAETMNSKNHHDTMFNAIFQIYV